jgi:hypothetical protein
MENIKSGANIVQKINYSRVVEEFIEFYYNTWMTNPSNFISANLITEYSRLLVDDVEYKSSESIIRYLYDIWLNSGLKIELKKVSCLDSGSRRIDIVVNGVICKNDIKYNFTQYFLLAHYNNSWKFQNSILNIL